MKNLEQVKFRVKKYLEEQGGESGLILAEHVMCMLEEIKEPETTSVEVATYLRERCLVAVSEEFLTNINFDKVEIKR